MSPRLPVSPSSFQSGADRLVEYLQRHVHVLARQHERRRPAYGVVARAEDDEAALVALHLDAVAKLRRRSKGRALLDELDADHHAEAPHVADALVPPREPA